VQAIKPQSWQRHGLKPWIEAAKKRLHRNVLANRAREQTGPHRFECSGSWPKLRGEAGHGVSRLDARHKAVLKMQINKSDRNDAAGIARIMQTGWFKEVRVKDLDSHGSRRCCRAGRC
jgi:hypothetical protein